MELVAYFEEFLKNTVNLNQDRINKLDEKIETIDKFFKDNDDAKKYYKKLTPQGSYAQKTIIKPAKKDGGFDADLLMLVDENKEWEAKDYVDNVYKLFKDNKNYSEITHKRTRCVELDYKGDFHVDVVPFIERESEEYIANSKDNELERTNPTDYTKWLVNQQAESFNTLILVIRLFKYLRDVKQNFSAKSILLNTLIGNCVSEDEKKEDFKNVPTALLTIFERLSDFLQENEKMPIVVNPKLEEEDFNRHWDEEKYKNFKEKITSYKTKIKEAYEETDKGESIKKWQDVFGDKFPGKSTGDDKTKAFGAMGAKSKPWSC